MHQVNPAVRLAFRANIFSPDPVTLLRHHPLTLTRSHHPSPLSLSLVLQVSFRSLFARFTGHRNLFCPHSGTEATIATLYCFRSFSNGTLHIYNQIISVKHSTTFLENTLCPRFLFQSVSKKVAPINSSLLRKSRNSYINKQQKRNKSKQLTLSLKRSCLDDNG